MSLSHIDLNPEEQHIPIPIVDNEDLNILILAISEHAQKAGPEKSDNQQKIASLMQALKFLSAEAASPTRSVKIHTAVMNTYLIDGFVEQRKKIKKGEPSIRTSLSAALMQFQANTQSRLFVGHVGIDTKREDLIETQIMHSVCSLREARELTDLCYKRTMEAFVAAIIDEKKMPEAQRIYQNAKRVVIEIEDKFKTSSNLWNTRLGQDRLGTAQANSAALLVPLNNILDNREKHSVESTFNQNKKQIVDALNTSFYPAVLIALLSLPPKDEKKPLSAEDQAKLNQLKKTLSRIENKYKPVGGNEDAIQVEVYKALMQLYVDAYIHQTSKDGRSLKKGPLLSYLEDTLKVFHDKTKNDMFYHNGSEPHDKILGSIQTKNDDSSVFRTEKHMFLREVIAPQLMTAAVSQGLLSDSAKSQDHFVYAYKTAEKMGSIAKMELNKQVTQALTGMQAAIALDPKSSTKEMKKMAEREEKLGKKFTNLLIIRDNVEMKEADLKELFDVAKATPRLMSAIQNYRAPVREQRANSVSERKDEASPSRLKDVPLVNFSAQDNSPRHSIFAKPSASTATTASNSAAVTQNNSRRPSLDEPPASVSASSRRNSIDEQKSSTPPSAPAFTADQLDSRGNPKSFVGPPAPAKINLPKKNPSAQDQAPKKPAAFTFTEIMANLHEKTKVESPSKSNSPSNRDDWDTASPTARTPKKG
jgi:hypothetical protein